MENKILAINAGSSTLKFQLYSMPSEKLLAKGMIDKIGKEDAEFVLKTDNKRHRQENIELNSPHEAIDFLLEQLKYHQAISCIAEIKSVAHRVAHGGENFTQSVSITNDVIEQLETLIELAPLHNPVNIAFIKAMADKLPQVEQIAVFDTSFHQSIKKEHFLYAIPYHFYQDDHIRRYGFHGTSHKYVSQVCAEQMNKPLAELKIISCHLGSGASICAIDKGYSVNTSMGFTPMAGLMMGTRCGDIDPSILVFLTKKYHLSIDDLNQIMNSKSGLLGLSGISNDCREVESAAKQGNERAQIALEIFIQRIRDFIGSYLIQMGGADVILFTGGIGENSDYIRAAVCKDLEGIGIELNEKLNQAKQTFIHTQNSRVKLAIINTNEELMMTREAFNIVFNKS
ncbi:acetate/propionate family kinase [Vibrio sp. MA40-2]|uniref:acetate/propionate family kinase n=1 Tax=Vibrio sp. MA40-2 TaxID=3391828 RepID=UPI0039A711C4